MQYDYETEIQTGSAFPEYHAQPWTGFRTKWDLDLAAKFNPCGEPDYLPGTVAPTAFWKRSRDITGPESNFFPGEGAMPSPTPGPMPPRPGPMPRPSPGRRMPPSSPGRRMPPSSPGRRMPPSNPMVRPSPTASGALGKPKIITCADGTKTTCNSGTRDCADNSPVYCK